MESGLGTLPPAILQDILYNGQLAPRDLASLEATSYLFRAASGIQPYRFKSITELAAHHACQSNPLFENFPARVRSELLARCEGNWKRVLYFLESLLQASQRSSAGNNVITAAGKFHTTVVNGRGEVFSCGFGGAVLGQEPPVSPLLTPTQILLPNTARRIVQISAIFNHAAFVTEFGQVYTFGRNESGCCGVGEQGSYVSTPTLVTTLQRIPCHQVATGNAFTLAITRAGEVFSWGCNSHGQLGHGDMQEQHTPMQIEHFNESNPVAQVSAGAYHTLAVTKSGQLFSWGSGSNYCLGHEDEADVRARRAVPSELRPKRINHGGFDDLFIVSVSAGDEHSAAIDSLGHVYTWGKGYCGALGHGDETDQRTPVLVAALESFRAIQVMARRRKTFVLADDGVLRSFGWVAYFSLGVQNRAASDKVFTPQSLFMALQGYKVAAISAGQYHTVVVTTKNAIFGFGDNEHSQLGIGNPVNTSRSPVRIPTEVFTAVTGVVQD